MVLESDPFGNLVETYSTGCTCIKVYVYAHGDIEVHCPLTLSTQFQTMKIFFLMLLVSMTAFAASAAADEVCEKRQTVSLLLAVSSHRRFYTIEKKYIIAHIPSAFPILAQVYLEHQTVHYWF